MATGIFVLTESRSVHTAMRGSKLTDRFRWVWMFYTIAMYATVKMWSIFFSAPTKTTTKTKLEKADIGSRKRHTARMGTGTL